MALIFCAITLFISRRFQQ